MNWDLFLAWLSEKGRGSWQDLKQGYDWLSRRSETEPTNAWIVARDLSALGHLEITWDQGGKWAIAPPVLTLLPDSGRALLTGARTRALYVPPLPDAPEGDWGSGCLVDAVNDLDLWLEPWPQRDGPTTVTVAVEREANASELATVLGIPFTYEVSEQLARLLPPLATYQRHWLPGELLRGFDAEMFDPAKCLWEGIAEPEASGLYRCRTWNQMIHALCDPVGQWFRVAPGPAVYEVLRWDQRGVLEYNERARSLTVPGTAPLPLLAARAATLCSGRVPRRTPQQHSFSRVTYVNVPPPIARRIAQSLDQELKSA